MKVRRLLIPLAITFNVLGCWVHWEAVVRVLKNCCPQGWSRTFTAPFYIIDLPVWLWHDLAYTLIIAGTIILGYYAIKNNNCK